MEAKKRLGQNFLNDTGIIQRIVQNFRPQPDQQVIEIGPGRGALTGGLIASGADVVAVEFDRDMVSHLQQRFKNAENFRLISGDILRITLADCFPDKKVRVIGNLPYNISSPILFHLLDQIDVIRDGYFMLQKEVVDRIVADPGSKQYGRPSVILQRSFTASTDLGIPPEAFSPQPKVQSAMLRLVPRETPVGGEIDDQVFRKLVTAAFSQRRKTLRNTLKNFLSQEHIEACGVDPGSRAETVSVADFTALTSRYCELV